MVKGEIWIPRPSKQPKPKILPRDKTTIQHTADLFIDSELRPFFIKPPTKGSDASYIVDIYSKWHGVYLYFCSKYRCPADNCISEFFEDKFVRIEYIENNLFNLSFKRHTGQWWELHRELSLEQRLRIIKDDPNFQP